MKDTSTLKGKIESTQFCSTFLSYLSSESGSVLLLDLDDDTARNLVTVLINIIQVHAFDKDQAPAKRQKASLIAVEKKVRADDTESNMIHGAALNALFKLMTENSLVSKHISFT